MRQREKGTAISHVRTSWWLCVFYCTRTRLASPTTSAEFQTNISTRLHLLQKLSQLPLLNYLFQCEGMHFYLFYSSGGHLCSSSHPTAFSLARCPELCGHGCTIALWLHRGRGSPRQGDGHSPWTGQGRSLVCRYLFEERLTRESNAIVWSGLLHFRYGYSEIYI